MVDLSPAKMEKDGPSRSRTDACGLRQTVRRSTKLDTIRIPPTSHMIFRDNLFFASLRSGMGVIRCRGLAYAADSYHAGPKGVELCIS